MSKQTSSICCEESALCSASFSSRSSSMVDCICVRAFFEETNKQKKRSVRHRGERVRPPRSADAGLPCCRLLFPANGFTSHNPFRVHTTQKEERKEKTTPCSAPEPLPTFLEEHLAGWTAAGSCCSAERCASVPCRHRQT